MFPALKYIFERLLTVQMNEFYGGILSDYTLPTDLQSIPEYPVKRYWRNPRLGQFKL